MKEAIDILRNVQKNYIKNTILAKKKIRSAHQQKSIGDACISKNALFHFTKSSEKLSQKDIFGQKK